MILGQETIKIEDKIYLSFKSIRELDVFLSGFKILFGELIQKQTIWTNRRFELLMEEEGEEKASRYMMPDYVDRTYMHRGDYFRVFFRSDFNQEGT